MLAFFKRATSPGGEGLDWNVVLGETFVEPVKKVLGKAGAGELTSQGKIFDAVGQIWAQCRKDFEQRGYVPAEGCTLDEDLRAAVFAVLPGVFTEMKPQLRGRAVPRKYGDIEKAYQKHSALPRREAAESPAPAVPPGLAEPADARPRARQLNPLPD